MTVSARRKNVYAVAALLAVTTAAGLAGTAPAGAAPPAAANVTRAEPAQCPYVGDHPVLRPGTGGTLPALRHLYCLLEVWGYELPPFDGIYGSYLATVVRTFQSAHGLSPTGIVGRETWDALHAVPSARPS
jgi:peptidoglycan hydrolase-like protein with peptidoglycan-binding domain